MNKKERYKKLMRKVRLAARRKEPYGQWLDEMDALDSWLARNDRGWKPGGHKKFIKGPGGNNG